MTQTRKMRSWAGGLRSAPRVLASAATALAVLSACADEGDGSVLTSGDTSILVGTEGAGQEDMAGIGFGGRVGIVGKCLGIGRSVVVWPHGTEVVGESPLTVRVPELGEVAVGDHVEGGADAYADFLPEGIEELPSGCPEDELLAFYPGG